MAATYPYVAFTQYVRLIPMSTHNLNTDEGLRAAVEAIGSYRSWDEGSSQWVLDLAETIRWVRSADENTRCTYEFQKRLWEDNHVAAVGQGSVPVERALADKGFRTWIAKNSMDSLPATAEQQGQFLTNFYRELKQQLKPFTERVPHLKIFRVLAALYPDAMTTIASTGALWRLVREMGIENGLEAAQQHVWARDRLKAVLGPEAPELVAKAERMAIPWLLYARYVKAPDQRTEEENPPGKESSLLPLPAVRRRRGLTAIKGMFPAVLSTLEFVRDGVTREQLIDFLRSTSPDVKVSSLGVTINSYLGELDVIRLEGDRYVLTERGQNVLESQDPSYLADWLLTRILGVDRAIVDLRDKGALPAAELISSIRKTNPNWTSNFVPQAMISWLRSFGVIRTTAQNNYELTDIGQQWGSRIHWTPECLPAELDAEPVATPISTPERNGTEVVTSSITEIVTSVQSAGHFSAALIAQLHAGLWAHSRRHFAILTGLSGSGKTLLARAYARALPGPTVEPRLFTLPVQPGWYDPGALLGFPNPLRDESYVRTGFLDFLTAAAGDPARPYVAVFDEMNLSHPEQYMAPLLSAMETGDSIHLHNEGDFFDGVPGAIDYPNNLVLIGTVNMDETTHGLSDKVLDRSFVIEFWDIDLDDYPHWGKKGLDSEEELRTRKVLDGLLQALSPARLHFGWRVVDEILEFLGKASKAPDILSFDSALDGVIYAKVLPKLRGEDTPRLRDALKKCEKVLTDFDLTRSQAKVAELAQELDRTGTARFWR